MTLSRTFIFLFLLFFNDNHANDVSQNYCTAVDSKYFDCLLGLIGSIHKNNYDQLNEIMVYDLGLSNQQKNILLGISKVNVYQVEITNPNMLEPFNTRSWGKSVPGWYSWKPVVIKQALEKYETVLWIDAGTLICKPLESLFRHIAYNGYFFHNGCSWKLKQQTTEYVINLLKIDSNQLSMIGLESGLMGFTRALNSTVVLPMYELSKNLKSFEDDGTAGRGFGDNRHDQTLFSYFAIKCNYTIHHHYKNPLSSFFLQTSRDDYELFHIACNPEDRTDNTHVYCARFDTNNEYFNQYIQYNNLKR